MRTPVVLVAAYLLITVALPRPACAQDYYEWGSLSAYGAYNGIEGYFDYNDYSTVNVIDQGGWWCGSSCCEPEWCSGYADTEWVDGCATGSDGWSFCDEYTSIYYVDPYSGGGDSGLFYWDDYPTWLAPIYYSGWISFSAGGYGDGAASVAPPCPPNQERDALNYENVTYGIGRPDGPFRCADYTQTRRSAYFSFAELNKSDYSWALIKDALIAPDYSGFGMDLWREYIGLGPRTVNSGYRNPVRNANVNGRPNSRHLYGDAADLNNNSYPSEDEYWTMVNAGWAAGADYVETPDLACGYQCAHADWRFHGGSYQ